MWRGIDGFFRWLDSQQDKMQFRVMKARYRGKDSMPDCGGSRLRKDASYVKVAGKTINESVRMPVSELPQVFDTLTLTDRT